MNAGRAPTLAEQLMQGGSGLKAAQTAPKEAVIESRDERSDLLAAIQRGKNLKKVNLEDEKAKKAAKRISGFAGVMDRAMQNRRAYFDSDGEEGLSGTGSESDDDDWDDDDWD